MTVKLDGNGIADLSPLSNLSRLTSLSLCNINLTDAGLQKLGQASAIINGTFNYLQALYLSTNCQLTSVMPLAFLSNIPSFVTLDVSNTNVTSAQVPSTFLTANAGIFQLTLSTAANNTCKK